jgi:DNA-binding PadR family transcriptional regulator
MADSEQAAPKARVYALTAAGQEALAELRLSAAEHQVHSVDRAKALSRYLRQ